MSPQQQKSPRLQLRLDVTAKTNNVNETQITTTSPTTTIFMPMAL